MSKFVEISQFSCVSNSLMWQHIKGHKRFRTFAKYLRSLLAKCCQVAHLEGCKVIVDAEEKRKELHLCDTLSINDIFSHVQTEHNGSERIISILNALWSLALKTRRCHSRAKNTDEGQDFYPNCKPPPAIAPVMYHSLCISFSATTPSCGSLMPWGSLQQFLHMVPETLMLLSMWIPGNSSYNETKLPNRA